MKESSGRSSRWMAFYPIAGVIWAACLLWLGTVWKLWLSDQEVLLVWHWKPMLVLRWPLALLTVISVFIGWRASCRVYASIRPVPNQRLDGDRGWRLAPLMLAPLPALLALFADLLPAGLVSNGLFYGQSLVLAFLALRVYLSVRQPRIPGSHLTVAKIAWGLFVAGTCIYGGGGLFFSSRVGEHLGDEGHYRIQAQSLHEDGDLDIANNLNPDVLMKKGRASLHVARASRPPHLYSWHPAGLSMLAAPLWPWGLAGRHLLLGLIAGAGLAGLFLLAMQGGAGRRAAGTLTLALGGSTYWILYAFRFLPETLGATLLTWSFWGVAAQHRRPWTATVVAALVNGFLPFAHARFLPVSLMAFGFFGLMGLFGGSAESWPKRLGRLTVFTLLTAVGYGAYAYTQHCMFVGGSSYSIERTLFSYLPGGWNVFADVRGAAPLLPLLYWMIPAALVWSWKERARPLFPVGLLLTFAACVLTSCTNLVSVGGSCVQGRYLLVVIPLLVPGTAFCLRRSGVKETLLFMFLTVLSAVPLYYLLFWLPYIGRNFTLPLVTIGAQPLFSGLFSPYCHLQVPYTGDWHLVAGTLFPLAGLVGMLLLLLGNRRTGWIMLAGVLLVAGWVHRGNRPQRPLDGSAQAVPLLRRVNIDRAYITSKPSLTSRWFFDIFRASFGDFNANKKLVLTSIRDVAAKPPVFRLQDLENNDWAGRSYRWLSLTAPFTPSSGTWIMHASGTITGDARPHLAIKEGAHVLAETAIPVQNGRWEVTQDFTVKKKRGGDLYLLLRVEDEGEWTCEVNKLCWSRYNPDLLESLNLTLRTDETR